MAIGRSDIDRSRDSKPVLEALADDLRHAIEEARTAAARAVLEGLLVSISIPLHNPAARDVGEDEADAVRVRWNIRRSNAASS